MLLLSGVIPKPVTAEEILIINVRSLGGDKHACSAGDAGLIPGSGRSPGEGNGNPPQYSCLGNLMDRGAWWARVCVVAKELDMTEPPQSYSRVASS